MLLIATPNNKGEVPDLISTAEVLDYEIYRGWRVPNDLIGRKGIVYGELLFCEAVATQMNWVLKRNPLDWITTLPEEYVRRKITYTTLGEARKLTEQKFIKPANDKFFQSRVYSSGQELPKSILISDDVPVLISDVMKFTSEYRLLIKDRVITTACCYWYRDRPMEVANQEADINKPERYNNNYNDVVKFVNTLLKDKRVECADAAVIDVARCAKDTYVVLESDPVYAAGLYGCELVAALDTLTSSCEQVK